MKKFYIGQRVRFHPVIGGKHDGKIYTIRAFGDVGEQLVAWLHEKPACVAVRALSVPEPGFGFVDPKAP